MGFPWTEQLTQGITIAAVGVHTAAQAAGTYLTSAIDMKKFRKVLFIIDVGTLGTSGNVNFQVTAATSSGGTYSNVSGTAITQVSTNNGYMLVEVSADHLQNTMGNGYEFLKGSLVVAGSTASQVAVIALGAIGESEPTSGYADASLAQTVVL